MNAGRWKFAPPAGLTGSPLRPQASSKPNRLSRSFRQSQQTAAAESPQRHHAGFETPTRVPRCPSAGAFSAESPTNDSDFQQDIVWDATSPPPGGRGKRGRKQRAVDISAIVSRIAPKHGRPEVPEPTLQQWIGDSATIPCTPDLHPPKAKKKSPRPNRVDDLLELAKQFDFNMFHQDQEDLHHRRGPVDQDRPSLELLSQDVFGLEEDRSCPVAMGPAAGADLRVQRDRRMEDDLDFLFDGPTQRLSGTLSPVSSQTEEVKPPRGPSSGVSTTARRDSLDFQDDWDDDDLLDDSLVLEMTQNPQNFTAPRHCSTQKPVNGPGVPVSGPGVPVSGPRVPVSGPGVPFSGPRVSGPGLPVSGPRVPVSGPGVPVSGPGVPVSGPRVPVSGPGVSGPGLPVSGPRVPVSGPRVPVSGPRVPVSGPGVSGPGLPVSGPRVSGPGLPVSGPRVSGPGLPVSGPRVPVSGPRVSGPGLPVSGPRVSVSGPRVSGPRVPVSGPRVSGPGLPVSGPRVSVSGPRVSGPAAQRRTFRLESGPVSSVKRLQADLEVDHSSDTKGVSGEPGPGPAAKSDSQETDTTRQSSSSRHEAAASDLLDEDLNSFFLSDPVWDDPADDDLLRELCDDLENQIQSAGNGSAKQAPPVGQNQKAADQQGRAEVRAGPGPADRPARVQGWPRKDQSTFKRPNSPVCAGPGRGKCSAAEIELKKLQAMERRRQRAAQNPRAPT